MFKYQYFTRLHEQKSTSKCCIDVFFIVRKIRICNYLMHNDIQAHCKDVHTFRVTYTPKYHLANFGLSTSFNFSNAAA